MQGRAAPHRAPRHQHADQRVRDETHLRKLIEFGARRREYDRLLVHCQMGRSRSAAAALILLIQPNPGREIELATMLRAAAPHGAPNRLMIEIADRILGCEGRLVAGLEAMREPRVLGLLRDYLVLPSGERSETI